MKKNIASIIFTLFVFQAFAWGPTGHRVVGQIAELHLSKKAKKNIAKVLNGESLAMCSTWMDFIKSDRSYDSLSNWHYVTIPQATANYHHEGEAKGDVLQGIYRFQKELENKTYSVDEAFALKCLVHLMGDIHQPLHVGKGDDRGGNDIKVTFFGEKTNLHRVWDSDMIESQKLSYTEYAQWINTTKKDQIAKWVDTDIINWADESINFRAQIYNLPEDKKLGYRYIYDNIETVNIRLLQAGIRLANVLNEIYG